MNHHLDPKVETWRAWLGELSEQSERVFNNIESGPCFGRPSKPLVLPDIVEEPRGLSESLKVGLDGLMEYGLNPASGGYFAYVPGGGVPVAAIADFFACLTNRYAGIFGATPAAVLMENDVIRWMLDLVGFHSQGWGVLASGGSLAAIYALCAARDQIESNLWPRCSVYMTTQVHHSLQKGLRTVGMGVAIQRTIPSDSSMRMDLGELKKAIEDDLSLDLKPWLVVASAGTTNTGAIDPLPEIAELCRSHGIWLHVDAAYGGFFLLTKEGQKKLHGIDQANSVVLDPHKGLFMPYGVGAVLVRDRGTLAKSFKNEGAHYLQDLEEGLEPSSADFSPELTRHFRAFRIWLSLQVHGVKVFRESLEEKLALAREVYEALGKQDQILLHQAPQLSIFAFAHCMGDDMTNELMKKMQQSGKIHVSSTLIEGKLHIRFCALCFRSQSRHGRIFIEEVLNAIQALS